MRYTSWILATPLELLVLWFLISVGIRIGRSLIQGFIQTWEYSDYLHFGLHFGKSKDAPCGPGPSAVL